MVGIVGWNGRVCFLIPRIAGKLGHDAVVSIPLAQSSSEEACCDGEGGYQLVYCRFWK